MNYISICFKSRTRQPPERWRFSSLAAANTMRLARLPVDCTLAVDLAHDVLKLNLAHYTACSASTALGAATPPPPSPSSSSYHTALESPVPSQPDHDLPSPSHRRIARHLGVPHEVLATYPRHRAPVVPPDAPRSSAPRPAGLSVLDASDTSDPDSEYTRLAQIATLDIDPNLEILGWDADIVMTVEDWTWAKDLDRPSASAAISSAAATEMPEMRWGADNAYGDYDEYSPLPASPITFRKPYQTVTANDEEPVIITDSEGPGRSSPPSKRLKSAHEVKSSAYDEPIIIPHSQRSSPLSKRPKSTHEVRSSAAQGGNPSGKGERTRKKELLARRRHATTPSVDPPWRFERRVVDTASGSEFEPDSAGSTDDESDYAREAVTTSDDESEHAVEGSEPSPDESQYAEEAEPNDSGFLEQRYVHSRELDDELLALLDGGGKKSRKSTRTPAGE